MGVLDVLRAALRHARPDPAAAATFIGPPSRAFDWENALRAYQMVARGEPRGAIWNEAGTGFTKSGKVFQEVSDHDFAFDIDRVRNSDPTRFLDARLGDLVSAPALFNGPRAAVPEMENLLVRIPPLAPGETPLKPYAHMEVRGGVPRPSQMVMQRSTATFADPMWGAAPAAIHEIGHGAQFLHGLPVGTNASIYYKAAQEAVTRRHQLQMVDKARALLDASPGLTPEAALRRAGATPEEAASLSGAWGGVVKAMDLDRTKIMGDPLAYVDPVAYGNDRYHSTGGELASRIAQQSWKLTPAQRRQFSPYERAPLIAYEPMTWEKTWDNAPTEKLHNDAIFARIKQGDALGRDLGRVISAIAGGGGVLSALNAAMIARDAETRKERQRGRA